MGSRGSAVLAPRIVEARLVGVAGDLDLALLSIAVSGLAALPIAD